MSDTTTKQMNRLYSGDTFEHKGYTFKFIVERDDDMQEPWKEHDGHGIISDWTRRDKTPGERVLASDRESKRYYDIQETMKTAKRDGWGVAPAKANGLTKGQIIALAVEEDFERMRAWCNDEWEWCYVRVTLLDEDGEETDYFGSLGGIDGSDQTEYLTETAYELADEVLYEAIPALEVKALETAIAND